MLRMSKVLLILMILPDSEDLVSRLCKHSDIEHAVGVSVQKTSPTFHKVFLHEHNSTSHCCGVVSRMEGLETQRQLMEQRCVGQEVGQK